MVHADVKRSSRDIGQMFADRDLSGIVAAGGLAVAGFVMSLVAGGAIMAALGLDTDPNRFQRRDMLVIAAGAVISAIAMVHFFGTGIGGALGIGALTAVGFALFGFAFGTGSDFDEGYFRDVVGSAMETPRPRKIAAQ